MNYASLKNFWNSLPFISGLVIAAMILMYFGYVFDPNKGSSSSFFDSVVPTLSEIRNGRYWGLLTSSLLQANIVFLAWGIWWLWYFGKTLENQVNIFFYIFLIISSIVFPELFQALVFEKTGYGGGGIAYALFGFVWFMSMYEPTKWFVSHAQMLWFITFLFVFIFLDYTKLYEVGIGGLVGGFLWGVFVGFVSRSMKTMALQIAILMLVLGLFLVPIFWAPWQTSWLLLKAEENGKQGKLAEAKELYSKVLKKDSENKEGKEGFIHILNDEARQCSRQRDFEKSKALRNQVLQIDPQNETAKKDLHVTELYEEYVRYYDQREYEKAKTPLIQILEIQPDDENTKRLLKHAELLQDFVKYYDQQQFDKAKDSLLQVLEIVPDDESVKKLIQYVELTKDFLESYKKKEFAKAKNSLLQILELVPDDEQAKRYLKSIQRKTK